MNGYELSRNWFSFSFDNYKCKTQHTALFFWIVELNNRFGWKKQFSLRTNEALETLSIGNKNTYLSALRDLDEWGFIKIISPSKNQNQACIVEISRIKSDTTLHTTLDTALIQRGNDTAYDTAYDTASSTDPIDKQVNKETIKQGNNETISPDLGNPENLKAEHQKTFGSAGAAKSAKVPTLQEVIDYFDQKGYTEEAARKAFSYYNDPMVESGGRVWKDAKGNTVKNWKQKMIGVWFKPEALKSQLSDKDQERVRKACAWATSTLNSILNTSYTPDEKNTVKAITARLLEGSNHVEFKSVLDKKVKEWKGTDMQKNLQPHILFGEKFTAYLQQPDFESVTDTPKRISISLEPYSR